MNIRFSLAITHHALMPAFRPSLRPVLPRSLVNSTTTSMTSTSRLSHASRHTFATLPPSIPSAFRRHSEFATESRLPIRRSLQSHLGSIRHLSSQRHKSVHFRSMSAPETRGDPGAHFNERADRNRTAIQTTPPQQLARRDWSSLSLVEIRLPCPISLRDQAATTRS